MRRVLDAADRGVKVRLILDDLRPCSRTKRSPRVRDATRGAVRLASQRRDPAVQRLARRTLVGRAVETVERLERMNHRMHNKLMVADNRGAIIGGRNIGNEYFGLSPDFNFRDLDVLGVGPVARQASSCSTVLEQRVGDAVGALGIASIPRPAPRVPPIAGLANAPSLARFPLRQPTGARSSRRSPRMHFGTSQVHTDAPRPGRAGPPHAARDARPVRRRAARIARHQRLHHSRRGAIRHPRTCARRAVRILTNSLASHDVPAVNSHYKQWRRPLLDAGVELYEVRRTPRSSAARGHRADRRRFMGLHVKAIVSIASGCSSDR